jgi:hypothetical protein
MKRIFRFPMLAVVASGLIFASCSKDAATPKTQDPTAQLSSNTVIKYWDYRGDSYCFTSEAGINLTNLPAGSPCVMMYRKNFTEVTGKRIVNIMEGKVNTADYPGVTFPYEWKGTFIDQDPRAYGYVWTVAFNIDATGNASASLRWSGLVDTSNLPPLQ